MWFECKFSQLTRTHSSVSLIERNQRICSCSCSLSFCCYLLLIVVCALSMILLCIIVFTKLPLAAPKKEEKTHTKCGNCAVEKWISGQISSTRIRHTEQSNDFVVWNFYDHLSLLDRIQRWHAGEKGGETETEQIKVNGMLFSLRFSCADLRRLILGHIEAPKNVLDRRCLASSQK